MEIFTILINFLFLIPTRAWELLAGTVYAQIKTDDYQIIKINSIFLKTLFI